MRLPRLVFPVLAAGVILCCTWSFLLAHDQGVVGAAATDIGAKDTPGAKPGDKMQARRTAIVELVDRVKSSVVNIHSERLVQGQAAQDLLALAPSQNRINGMGTGIVIDPRGYIVTNHHVVEDVNFIRIKLADGTTCNAQVVSRNHENDLALLKIDVKQKLQVMPLGTAQDLMVGESVTAIGNAYGYEHTVSSGIVSQIKRDVILNKEVSYKSLIQTDACINPGNSGGPLLNVHGELVGVNVAIRAGAQGIGFAIPVDTMIRVVSGMLKARHRASTFDGLIVRDQLENSPDGLVRTVVVDRVDANSPAALANLQKGDVISRLGDVVVQCSYDVDRALLDHSPNDRLAIVVRRQQLEAKAELTLQAAEAPKATMPELVWRKLGFAATPVKGDLVSRVDSRLRGGLKVVQINPAGVAAKSGMKEGDILVGLNEYETVKLDDVGYVLTHPDLARLLPLTILVIRDRQLSNGLIQRID